MLTHTSLLIQTLCVSCSRVIAKTVEETQALPKSVKLLVVVMTTNETRVTRGSPFLDDMIMTGLKG